VGLFHDSAPKPFEAGRNHALNRPWLLVKREQSARTIVVSMTQQQQGLTMTTLTRRHALGLLGGAAVLGLSGGSASAEDLTMSPAEIIDAFDAPAAALATPEGSAAPLTRDIKVRRRRGKKVELTIFFETDSARITRRSMVQLEPLGQALRSPRLKQMAFVIIGHTDAVGNPRYNRTLSLKRARAVRGYLAEAYGINPRRLSARGMGSDDPRDPYRPDSDINRRVEVALA
jgi:outer membrane protein OmpA-like peptidoglycan-associated protein